MAVRGDDGQTVGPADRGQDGGTLIRVDDHAAVAIAFLLQTGAQIFLALFRAMVFEMSAGADRCDVAVRAALLV